MKTHAIIPIFLPHEGCPNDCIFCNQKAITARPCLPAPASVMNIIDSYLETIKGRGIETIEIAFFGGSFTGMPTAVQDTYLEIAKDYKERGLIDKIRLSTRPDYINDEILKNLKSASVDIIELGVQSLDDQVLALANRGHDSAVVYKSAALIRSYGFTLGIQLMIGLPGDTFEKSVASARKTVMMHPSIARIYPTVVIRGTGLEALFLKGEYAPPNHDEMVRTAKEMCLILRNAGINVIRIGLKSSDFIAEGRDALGGTYHPAFRQVVEGEIIKDILETQLRQLLENQPKTLSIQDRRPRICFLCAKENLSDMIGHKKSNKLYFERKYSSLTFVFKTDASIGDHDFKTVLL